MIPAPPTRAHGEGIHCTACGYHLQGVPIGPCPECGQDQGPAVAPIRAERERILRWWRRRRVGYALWWLAATGACGLLFGTLFGAPAGLTAMAIPLALVLITAGAGMLLSLRAPAHHRVYIRAAWLRSLWALHVPWLFVPAGVCIVWLASAIDTPWLPADFVAISLMIAYCLGILLCVPLWGGHFLVAVEGRMRLRLGAPLQFTMCLLALAAVLASSVAGGAALSAAASRFLD